MRSYKLNNIYPLFDTTSIILCIISILVTILSGILLFFVAKTSSFLGLIITGIAIIILLPVFLISWIIRIIKRKDIRKNTFTIIGNILFFYDTVILKEQKILIYKKIINQTKVLYNFLKQLCEQEDLGKFTFNRKEFRPITLICCKDKVYTIRNNKSIRVSGTASKSRKIQIDINNNNIISLLAHELGHILLFQLKVSEEEAHNKMHKIGF